MATQYLCELAWLGGDVAEANVLVTVDGDKIAAIHTDATSDSATRLAGLTLPGLANAHSHAFHRVLRGRTQLGIGSFWTWREQMYAIAAKLTPESYFYLARAVFGEMALAGITCVGEFHYVHHQPDGSRYPNPNAMGEAVIAAAGAAGVRLTLLDACYLHGGIGAEPHEVQRRFSDGDALSWATRASALVPTSTAVRRGAAIHSVRAVDPPSMEVVAAWAAERSAPLHAHVSEQKAENEQSLENYGLTPTSLLVDRGILGPLFTAVHGTHLAYGDIDAYGAHGCTVCFCPTTERDLADGIGPSRMLVDAGARLALGSDSHAVIDLFEEARAVELNERLVSNVRGSLDSQVLLRAATENGYHSLGWPEGGRIEVGALADFISVRLDSVRTAGTRPSEALEATVFAACATDVHHVVMGGEVIVGDGRHRTLDVTAELARTISTA